MKQVFSKYTRLLAAGFVLPMIACAQGDFDSAAIDNVFADFNAETPGCALGVVQSGQLVYGRGYGMANLEHDIPITTESVFRIGSVSKQFTAAVAALAAMDGYLERPLLSLLIFMKIIHGTLEGHYQTVITFYLQNQHT